jgi:hypothetical protein
MAFAAGTNWEFNTGGSNNNGGGFDTGNANMPTDLAATVATGNAPIVTSASYNFVASDVGHWVFVKSGVNWTPGWYIVVSVADNAATLNATIGTAVTYSTNINLIVPNTVAGCATDASPTSGTWAIDYSQSTTVKQSYTDLVIDHTLNTKITSAAERAFAVCDVGNILNVTAGVNFTVQRIQIVSVASGAATCDKAVGTIDSTGGTAKLGGCLALPLATIMVLGIAGNTWWMKAGTYTLTESITGYAHGTTAAYIYICGYNATRGDNPTGTNRPLIACAAYSPFSSSNYYIVKYVECTTTTLSGMQNSGTGSGLVFCKSTNSSTTADRVAISGATTSAAFVINCEATNPMGKGINCYNVINCFVHDLTTGISDSAMHIIGNIVARTTSVSILATNNNAVVIINNTLYGGPVKCGTGISINGQYRHCIANNILVNFITGISNSSALYEHLENNTLYNCTTPYSNVNQGANDIALDPEFVGVGNTGSDLCTNGTLWTGATTSTPPNDWAVKTNGLFEITAGGQTGNYLNIAHNGANNNPEISFAFTTVVGKSYAITYYAQKGTATNATAKVGTTSGGTELGITKTHTDTDWNTQKVIFFEATATTTYFSVGATTSTNAQYSMIDTVTIYEQGEDFTPGSNMQLTIDWTKMGL